jgi:hypothetical protein
MLLVSNLANAYFVKKYSFYRQRDRDMSSTMQSMSRREGPFLVIMGDSLTNNAISPLRYADTEQSTWDSMAQKPQGSFSMRSNNCRPVTCIPLFVVALGVNDAIQTGGSDFKQSLGSLLQNLPDLR